MSETKKGRRRETLAGVDAAMKLAAELVRLDAAYPGDADADFELDSETWRGLVALAKLAMQGAGSAPPPAGGDTEVDDG